MCLAAIRFAYPMSQVLFETSNNGNTLIGRATVRYDEFQVPIILVEYRTDRLFQVLALIVRGSHNRHFRAAGHLQAHSARTTANSSIAFKIPRATSTLVHCRARASPFVTRLRRKAGSS